MILVQRRVVVRLGRNPMGVVIEARARVRVTIIQIILSMTIELLIETHDTL
jgi:hypothetical protein